MAATISPASSALDAFEATAHVYDAFTRHHRHHVWMDMLEGLLRPHGLLHRGRLLDVGCGTGKSFVPWEERGWSVVACDASPSMLAHATARAAAGTETLLADARDLPSLGSFDLVAMFEDVVNYLDAGEHEAAFAGARRNLAPDGLFVFDVNTLYAFRTFFADTFVQEDEGCVLVWRGLAEPDFGPGDAADALLDSFVATPAGEWERRTARHREFHHPIERIDGALRAAGLRILSVYGVDDDCRIGPLDECVQGKAVVVATHAER